MVSTFPAKRTGEGPTSLDSSDFFRPFSSAFVSRRLAALFLRREAHRVLLKSRTCSILLALFLLRNGVHCAGPAQSSEPRMDDPQRRLWRRCMRHISQ